MLDNCGDSVGFPGSEFGAGGVDHGRLAGLYLQLYSRRFTGRAYVSAQSRTMTIAFRDGTPVMIDSSAPESSLADDLVERGILSRDEYAELIARVTEDLVENEDVAVCEHAVSLGFLSEEQIRRELSERVRSKLIQSLALVDCEVELDDAPDALSGVAEYPQNVGATVYMGVRTFYEEDVLRGYLPDFKRNYLRLLKSAPEIARFFELDMEEIALLNSIDPQLRAMEWFERADLETSHAIQLIGLLYIAGMCEFSSNAFVPPEAERSGVRTAARPDSIHLPSRAAVPAVREQRPGSRAAVPAVREEVFEPRSGSRVGMPATVIPRSDSGAMNDPRVEPNTMPASSRTEGSGAHNPPRRTEGSGAHNAPRRTDGSGAHQPPRRPIVESNARTEGSGAHDSPRRPSDGSGAHNAFWRAPAADPSISRPRAASAPSMQAAHPPAAPQPRAADAGSESGGDAAAEALAEARARAREKRGAGYANAPRDPKAAARPPIAPEFETDFPMGSSANHAAVRNPVPTGTGSSASHAAVRNAPAAANANANPRNPGAPQPTAAAAAAVRNLNPPQANAPNQASPEYQKAHLKELMQRKHGVAPEAAASPGQPRRDPVRELRHAQESLRDGQYSRAEEQLRVLVEGAPDNDVIRTYHMWAQFRASQTLDPAQLSKLRDLAKHLISDGEHAGFACYVLAHLYLADKKDDQAEKYFRKAHQLDKTNKDAERHIVILERRKQHANEGDTGSQRKLFGISLGKKNE